MHLRVKIVKPFLIYKYQSLSYTLHLAFNSLPQLNFSFFKNWRLNLKTNYLNLELVLTPGMNCNYKIFFVALHFVEDCNISKNICYSVTVY